MYLDSDFQLLVQCTCIIYRGRIHVYTKHDMIGKIWLCLCIIN